MRLAQGVSQRPPNGVHGQDRIVRSEGVPVSKPISIVRNWAVEQVTAIVSVCRPLHSTADLRR